MIDQVPGNIIKEGSNPLPRSIVRRTPYILLDGEWRFELDADERGLAERWYIQHYFTRRAPFPGSLESYLATAKDEAEKITLYNNSDEAVAWYECDITVPAEWTLDREQITQLTFGACGYETRVWLNGHPLKTIEGEEIHFGEYNSFSYEFPTEILKDVNRLTIRVADLLNAEIPRGKQASHVYKQGGIWYQTISGAVRSLWIEPVSRNRLRSRLNVISNLPDRIVGLDFTMRIQKPEVYHLKVAIEPHDKEIMKAAPVTAEFELILEAGDQIQRVPMTLPGAAFWSPAAPNLYRISAQLQGGTSTTGIETNFGFRKIEARGGRVYLNNELFYLDGILYQPGVATFEEMRRHMLAVKKLGCNLVRIHIAGIDPRIFDLADEIGLLLWVEVPSPHSSTQISRRNHRAELDRMLPFITSHPSIVILSLYNEDWGAQDIAFNAETRRYIGETYDYLRLKYPQFLVVDNDGWNHVSREGRLCSNLMTAHIYTPDIGAWSSMLDRLTDGELKSVTAEPLVTGDPYFFRGQIPLIISEWGGFGFTGYGGPREAEEKCELIREFKREMRKRLVAGDIYTQLTSIEEETNGVIDPQSGELIIPAGIFDSSSIV